MNKLTLSALVAALALIAAPTYAGDVAAGKKIAEGSCADCHGDDGKGDDENDRLTFGVAEPRDLWLHVSGPAGSHVVVRNPDGLEPAEVVELGLGQEPVPNTRQDQAQKEDQDGLGRCRPFADGAEIEVVELLEVHGG